MKGNKLKQIQLRPNIAENDLNVKIKNIRKFLTKEEQVKVLLVFKGREIAHPELGRSVLQKIDLAISDLGRRSVNDKLKGPQIVMTIQPYKKRTGS